MNLAPVRLFIYSGNFIVLIQYLVISLQIDIQTLSNAIINQADLCVKCGMCSNQCPTYLIHHDENESPRGRVSLAQAIASKAIPDSDQVSAHIDSCLSCLRCEKICPSKVPFSLIMENTQQLIHHTDDYNKIINTISNLKYSQWKILGKIYRLTQLTGLLKLGSTLFFRKYRHYIIPSSKIKPVANHQEKIQLFTGCLSNFFDQRTQSSLINLLSACKVTTIIPPDQQCCGALAKHNHAYQISKQCQNNNQKSFSNEKPILFTATGCGAHLKKLKNTQKNSIFSTIEEAGQYLLNHKNFVSLEFASLKKTVLIHSPCSEKNDLKQSSSYQLINKIPDIKILQINEATPCCGAAGNNMIKNPAEARLIREYTENEIEKAQPDIIVSTNYPCAMHIAAGLREKGLDIEVMHPLSLLQEQLISR